MEKTTAFSARLKEAMGDMTLTCLGNKIGMSKQAISTYINDIRSPKRPVINAIADVLGVNPVWLMGYDVTRYRSEAVLTSVEKEKHVTSEDERLSEREKEYIKMYRAASPELQAAAVAMLKAAEKIRLARDLSTKD